VKKYNQEADGYWRDKRHVTEKQKMKETTNITEKN